MEIYKVNGKYYKDKILAEKMFKHDATEYFKEHKLDECDLENLPCGGKQYVADRFLKRDNAKVVSYLKIKQVTV